MKYFDCVSAEPLSEIEAIECSKQDLRLRTTQRFRRLFNELESAIAGRNELEREIERLPANRPNQRGGMRMK